MKKITAIIILLFFIARPVVCDIEALLGNGLGARGVGMGMAQVSASKGVEGVYWNPATIAEIRAFEISTTASEVYGTNYKTIGMVLPTIDGGWGLLVLTADQGGIPQTSLDGSGRPVLTGSDFGYDAKAIYLSYARDFGAVAVGTSVKYLAEDLAGNSASGIGADVGVELKPSKIISLGAKIENVIVPHMEWDTDSGHTDRIEPNIRIGAALIPYNGNLQVTGDLNFKQDKSPELFFGGEYKIIQNLRLRGGVFDGRLSAGVGLNYKNFGIDYSYAKGNDFLEDSHRVSLSFSLGTDRGQATKPIEEEEVKIVALENYKELEYQEISETTTKMPEQKPEEEILEEQKLEEPEIVEEKPEPKLLEVSTPSYVPWYSSSDVSKTSDAEKEKEIKLSCASGLPGRILYFKVRTSGIDAERVSVVYNRQLIELYTDDQNVWKGAIMLSPDTQPGNHRLKVYVADSAGHLHNGLKEFNVRSLPQPEIKTQTLHIDKANYFEVAVPAEVDRATLVLGNRKIPLQINNGTASANVTIEHDPERKVLYLSDKDGHLFSYPLSLSVENGSSAERMVVKAENLPENRLEPLKEKDVDNKANTGEYSEEIAKLKDLKKKVVSKESDDILIKAEEDNLSSILLVLLGVTTGLGLWMAFGRRRS